MQLADSKDSADLASNTKDAQPEAKKRKRSQRACVRCRGQKLKCDGVFPCARCLKLKLVCKEPSEANTAGTPSSHRVLADDRDGQTLSAPYSSSASNRLQSQASMHFAPSGLPLHAPAHPPYGSNMSEASHLDRTLGGKPMNVTAQQRQVLHLYHPSDRFIYSLPDAVHRIDKLERIVSRLIQRVDGNPSSFERNGTSTAAPPSSSRSVASPQKLERRRPRTDILDDSDAEVDELQDGLSEASVPLLVSTWQRRHDSRECTGTGADERSGFTRSPDPATGPVSTRSFNNDNRHTLNGNPIKAGLVTLEMAQTLLEVFLTYCYVFAPFLDLDEEVNAASLSASDPFLLSVLVTIGALYQESSVKADNALRSDLHAGLSSHTLSQLGVQLCSSEPTLSSVQAILLIAYWPQAFAGSPDEKLLASHASNVLQIVARHTQATALDGDRVSSLISQRLPPIWSSLRAFESLAAIESGIGAQLTDHDLFLSKAPRLSRSSTPKPYLVRAVSVLKEVQMWLGEMSCNSPLPLAKPPQPNVRFDLTHDWDRFKYLQSQLFDLEKRWLASETEYSQLERIVGLVDRWTLQIYLAAVALKSASLGYPPKASNGYDVHYEEDSARFVAAYRHDMRQACQVLMNIFTDPEINGALLYAPGYLLRRFGQAAAASALLIDFHDAEQTRSAQELIYLCSKRFDQLDQLGNSTYTAHLSWLVRSSYEKAGGRFSATERDARIEAKAPDSMSRNLRHRWLDSDLFSIFFGVGLTLNASVGIGNCAC